MDVDGGCFRFLWGGATLLARIGSADSSTQHADSSHISAFTHRRPTTHAHCITMIAQCRRSSLCFISNHLHASRGCIVRTDYRSLSTVTQKHSSSVQAKPKPLVPIPTNEQLKIIALRAAIPVSVLLCSKCM